MSYTKIFIPKPKTCAHRFLGWLTNGEAPLFGDQGLYGRTHSINQSKAMWTKMVADPMLRGGWAEQRGEMVRLTDKGFERYLELQSKFPLDLIEVTKATKVTRFVPVGPYTGNSFNPEDTRPGCNDFLKCPSRVGSKFIFREGYEDGSRRV